MMQHPSLKLIVRNSFTCVLCSMVTLLSSCLFSKAGERAARQTVGQPNEKTPLITRLGSLRFCHGNGVRQLAFGLHDKSLVSLGNDGSVYIWDMATGNGQALRCASAAYCFVLAKRAGVIITGHDDGAIRVWRLADGQQLQRWTGHKGPVVALALSPDETRVLSGGGRLRPRTILMKPPESFDDLVKIWALDKVNYDTQVIQWDRHNGKILNRISGYEYGTKTLLYTSQGKHFIALNHQLGINRFYSAMELTMRVAKSARDITPNKITMNSVTPYVFELPGTQNIVYLRNLFHSVDVRFLNLATGKISDRLKLPEGGRACAMAISTSGKRLAVVFHEKITLFATATGKKLRQLNDKIVGCSAIAFSTNGKILVAAGNSPILQFWDLTTGKKLTKKAAPQPKLSFVRFLPEANKLLAGGQNVKPFVIDIQTKKKQILVKKIDFYLSGILAFSNGRILLNRIGPMELWDTTAKKKMATFDSYYHLGVLTPDGTTIAASYNWDSSRQAFPDQLPRFCTVTLFNIKQPLQPYMLGKLQRWDNAVSFIGNMAMSKYLTTPMAAQAYYGINNDMLLNGACTSLLFTPNSKNLVVSADGVHLWDVTRRKKIWHTAIGDTIMLHGFCRNGTAIVGSDWPNARRLRIWDIVTGKLLVQWHCAPTRIGQGWIASRKRTNNSPFGPEYFFNRQRSVAAIAPLTKIIAVATGPHSGDYGIEFRHLYTGKLLGRIAAHHGDITDLHFSKDGNRICSVSSDGTLALWEVRKCFYYGKHKVTTKADLLRLWQQLGNSDEAKAYQAVDEMTAHGKHAVTFLHKRMQPISAHGIDKLIHDLDSDRFVRRAKAIQQIRLLEFAALPMLVQAVRKQPTLELHDRIRRLLDTLKKGDHPPEVLRQWRGVTVLSRIEDQRSRAILLRITQGADAAKLTRRAKQALVQIAFGT